MQRFEFMDGFIRHGVRTGVEDGEMLASSDEDVVTRQLMGVFASALVTLFFKGGVPPMQQAHDLIELLQAKYGATPEEK